MTSNWHNTLHRRRAAYAMAALLLLIALPAIGCVETTAAGQVPQTDRFLSPQEAHALTQDNKGNPNFVIIDDRGPRDFEQSHIEDAINVPVADGFVAGIAGMDKTYLVYCATGCGTASAAMLDSGFKKVYEIRGGLNAWKSQGLPLV